MVICCCIFTVILIISTSLKYHRITADTIGLSPAAATVDSLKLYQTQMDKKYKEKVDLPSYVYLCAVYIPIIGSPRLYFNLKSSTPSSPGGKRTTLTFAQGIFRFTLQCQSISSLHAMLSISLPSSALVFDSLFCSTASDWASHPADFLTPRHLETKNQ